MGSKANGLEGFGLVIALALIGGLLWFAPGYLALESPLGDLALRFLSRVFFLVSGIGALLEFSKYNPHLEDWSMVVVFLVGAAFLHFVGSRFLVCRVIVLGLLFLASLGVGQGLVKLASPRRLTARDHASVEDHGARPLLALITALISFASSLLTFLSNIGIPGS